MKKYFRFLSLVTLTFYCSSCVSWRAAGVADLQRDIGKKWPANVYRVSTVQGKKASFKSDEASLEDGSLKVVHKGETRTYAPSEWRNLEEQHWSAPKTVGLTLGIVVGILGIVLGAAAATHFGEDG
ncbi:MAG: hypothetical protein U1F57_01840 [bacterium]